MQHIFCKPNLAKTTTMKFVYTYVRVGVVEEVAWARLGSMPIREWNLISSIK